MHRYILLLIATLAFQAPSYAMQEPLQQVREVAHSASELANDLVQVSTYYGRFKAWLSENNANIFRTVATVCVIALLGVAGGTYYWGTEVAMGVGKLYAAAVGKFLYGTLMLLPNFIMAGLNATTNTTSSIVRYAVENGITGLVTGGFGLAGWKLGKEFAKRAGIDPATDPKAHIAVCIIGCMLGLLLPFLWIRYRTAKLVEVGKANSGKGMEAKPEPKPSEHAALYALVYVLVVLCVVGGGAGTVYAVQVSEQARIEAEEEVVKKVAKKKADTIASLGRVKKHADGSKNGSNSPHEQLPAIDENVDEVVPDDEATASQLEEVTVPLDGDEEEDITIIPLADRMPYQASTPVPIAELQERLDKFEPVHRLLSPSAEPLHPDHVRPRRRRLSLIDDDEKASELVPQPTPEQTPEMVRSLYDEKTRIQYTPVGFLVACIEVGKLDYAEWVIKKYRDKFQTSVQFPQSYYKLDDLGNGRCKPSLLGQALLGAASNGYTGLVGLLYADKKINKKVYRILDEQGYNAIQLAVMGGHGAIANQLTEHARRTIVADALEKGAALKEAKATLDQAEAAYKEALKPIKVAFNEATRQAEATYNEATRQAEVAFNEATRQAEATFNEALKPIKAAYKEAYKEAKAAFDEALKEVKATHREATAAVETAQVAFNEALAKLK